MALVAQQPALFRGAYATILHMLLALAVTLPSMTLPLRR